ncbi:DUF1275 family protein [Streptomyces sp. yara]|uniref:DUF1275 family protein n=1 Tax=Streptomyces sp. yara TaxID=3458421 RepID=UPI004040368A
MTVLTVIAGAVDAASFLTLGKASCALVTGNALFLSFAPAGEGEVPVARASAAVAAFPAGAARGTPALAGLAARGRPWFVAGLTGEGLRVLGTSRGRGHDLGCSGDGSERPGREPIAPVRKPTVAGADRTPTVREATPRRTLPAHLPASIAHLGADTERRPQCVGHPPSAWKPAASRTRPAPPGTGSRVGRPRATRPRSPRRCRRSPPCGPR